MSKQPKILPMNETEILKYANRGFLVSGQVVKSSLTGKKYRIIANNNMPTSFEELHQIYQSKFVLEDI